MKCTAPSPLMADPNFKRPHFDSPAMRAGARGTLCVLCRCQPTHSCAHLPTRQIGFMSGWATKCPDWLIGDLCAGCHYRMDEGDWRNDIEIRWKAHALTLQRRIDQGILRVHGEAHAWPEWEFVG